MTMEDEMWLADVPKPEPIRVGDEVEWLCETVDHAPHLGTVVSISTSTVEIRTGAGHRYFPSLSQLTHADQQGLL